MNQCLEKVHESFLSLYLSPHLSLSISLYLSISSSCSSGATRKSRRFSHDNKNNKNKNMVFSKSKNGIKKKPEIFQNNFVLDFVKFLKILFLIS